MKRAIIIHGWEGSPDEPMHLWLKSELEKKGFTVIAPEMPEPETPHIPAWVAKIKETVSGPIEQTVFVGHSIGCQAIIRYLAGLKERGCAAGAVFIVPWTKLKMEAIEEEGEESVVIAKEWTETPVDFNEAKKHIKQSVAIFSDNDPFVPFSEKEVFKEKLGAKIIVESGKGHFIAEDGVKELSSALDAVLEISQN